VDQLTPVSKVVTTGFGKLRSIDSHPIPELPQGFKSKCNQIKGVLEESGLCCAKDAQVGNSVLIGTQAWMGKTRKDLATQNIKIEKKIFSFLAWG
jgi:hypothetical protein